MKRMITIMAVMFVMFSMTALAQTTVICDYGDSPPEYGNWTITQDTYCRDGTIYLNSPETLVSIDSYTLILDNVIIIFNDTTNPSFLGAIITKDAVLNFTDTTIKTANETLGSGQFFTIQNGGIIGDEWVGGTSDRYYFENVELINIGIPEGSFYGFDSFMTDDFAEVGGLTLYIAEVFSMKNTIIYPQTYQIRPDETLNFMTEALSLNYINNTLILDTVSIIADSSAYGMQTRSRIMEGFTIAKSHDVIVRDCNITIKTSIDAYGGQLLDSDDSIIENNIINLEAVRNTNGFYLGDTQNLIFQDNIITATTSDDGSATVGLMFEGLENINLVIYNNVFTLRTGSSDNGFSELFAIIIFEQEGVKNENISITYNTFDILSTGVSRTIEVQSPHGLLDISNNNLLLDIVNQTTEGAVQQIYISSTDGDFKLNLQYNDFEINVDNDNVADYQIVPYHIYIHYNAFYGSTDTPDILISDNTGDYYAISEWFGGAVRLSGGGGFDNTVLRDNSWTIHTPLTTDKLAMQVYLFEDINNFLSEDDTIIMTGSGNMSYSAINLQFGYNVQALRENITFNRITVTDWTHFLCAEIDTNEPDGIYTFISPDIDTSEGKNNFVFEEFYPTTDGEIYVYYTIDSLVKTTTGRTIENADVSIYNNATDDLLWSGTTGADGKTGAQVVLSYIIDSDSVILDIETYRVEAEVESQTPQITYKTNENQDMEVSLTFLEWLGQLVQSFGIMTCASTAFTGALTLGVIILIGLSVILELIGITAQKHIFKIAGFIVFIMVLSMGLTLLIGC